MTRATAAARIRRSARAPVPLVAQVFRALADGRFHSGGELAKSLRVSRSAVWKAVRSLRELGATLHAVRNRGYRLAHGSEPLEAARIRERLPREVRDHIVRIQAEWSIPSTNSALLGRPNPASGTTEVMLAEYQTAGRGRRGRAWLAPPGGAICLSLSWTFLEVPQDLGALGLVIGVCSLRVLRELGVSGAALKWPNDLLVGERKLAGVLIELRAESAGPACVVIGVGLNVALGAALLKQIAETGTAATDLATAGITAPSRNAIAASLVSACVRGLIEFERHGLKPFIEEWRAADALRGRPVNVTAAEGVARGLARGIDVHGALVVETPHGVKRFISGDVTVRP
jgi:BirA family biotin operon repressor/biotin-[acetyl-CoA-carboxylase] ligase